MTDKKTSDQETAAAIAEAIRAKRGARRRSSEGELAAMEASLLADLESFKDSTLDDFLEIDPPRHVTMAATLNTFPEIGQVTPVVPREQPSIQPVTPPTSSASSAGLLAQLRQQAELISVKSETESRSRAEAAQVLDGGLRLVFEYLNDLVQQLNVLRPVIPRSYTLFSAIEFKDLVWQRGFVDYRTYSGKPGAQLEQVSFSFNLKATQEVALEREAAAINSLQKMLLDSGVVFRCEEKRNERRMIERAIFHLEPEVKSTLRWQADPENRGVVLETRNFERFGDMRYFLGADALNNDMLEEFGHLLLGQTNRFRDFARR